MIAAGNTVTLHYTGKLTDGTVFDSSQGRDPLVVKMGERQVIPGFEKGLMGMSAGEKKTIHVSKEDGYQFHAELIQTVPRAAAPADMKLEEGMTLALRAPTGQVVPARVTKVTDTELTLDLNSPLAGKELIFDVEIVKVE
jgi:FKBP-type peptidyl-prolyl cis-trans isomerase 2